MDILEFKCKRCGGSLEKTENDGVAKCIYCGTVQTVPKAVDDHRVNLYIRAEQLRKNNFYDKAIEVYSKILEEDPTDTEAYWSLVLCRYGIEYVEDPKTKQHLPTVNRAQYTSIFADEDYRTALKYADDCQKAIYEQEAHAIDEIQKGYLAIAQNEEPFDIFICYKETDSNGRRTPDFVLARELYFELQKEGFKVFFSSITLEDKLGVEYEPYIFAALNSSKVMVVIGTRAEYLQSVWVKNEWSRYLALIKNGAKKVLIPAYRDMDPYDLPEEFSNLQAQDMSKLGFMQDLTRGIKKIIKSDDPKPTVIKETKVISDVAASATSPSVAPLLERAMIFIDDGEWESADEYCERALDIDPKNATAYLVKLLIDLRVHDESELVNCAHPFDDDGNFKKAIRFGDNELVQRLKGYNTAIRERNLAEEKNAVYKAACALMIGDDPEDYQNAILKFNTIPTWKDSEEKIAQCREKIENIAKDAEIRRINEIYYSACSLMKGSDPENYQKAINIFNSIPHWRDADQKIAQCRKKIKQLAEEAKIRHMDGIYSEACSLMATTFDNGYCFSKLEEAIEKFESIINWKDSKKKIAQCEEKIAEIEKKAEAARIEAERQAAIRRAKVKKYNTISSIIAGALVVCIIFAFVVTEVIIPSVRYNKAVELMNESKYSEAIDILKKIDSHIDNYKDVDDLIEVCELNIQKNNAYNKAVELQKAGKYAEAITAFEALGGYKDSAEKIIACKTEMNYGKAVALMNEGKYTEAIAAYEALNGYKDSAKKIIACQTAIIDIDYEKAVALMNEGKYTEAIVAFEVLNGYKDSAEKIAACQSEIDYEKAVALMNEGKYTEAIASFEALNGYKDSAEKISACQTEINYGKAVALMNDGKYTEAIAVFEALGGHKDSAEKIIVCQTAIKDLDYEKAVALMNDGKYSEAIVAFEVLNGYKDSAEKIAACQSEIDYEKAVALMNEGKYTEAIASFEALNGYKDSAEKIAACQSEIDYEKAVALMNEGKYTEAIASFEALNGYKDSAEKIIACQSAGYDEAVSLMNEGKYTEAIAAFEALNGYKDSAEKIIACQSAGYDEAVSLMNEGKYTEALTAFEALGGYKDSAEKIIACQTEINYCEAVALMNDGKYTEAIASFEALNGYKDSAEKITACNYEKAVALMNDGKYTEAVEIFEILGDYNDSTDLLNQCRIYLNLDYSLNGKSYTVSGFSASATDKTKAIIPSIFNGLPVTSIGSDAFRGCSGLTSISIPDSVTSIGSNAFRNCSGLKSITIPDSVTIIGNWAFSNCSSLTSITIPDSVTSIGSGAFYGCSHLTNITIPDSVTSIGSGAFYGCSHLTNITIPDSVTNIGSGAFYGCSHLTNITIPDSVTNIGSYVFYNCSSLTSITIPDGVTNIGSFVFYNCSSLTSITIPDSVTNIGSEAFHYCTNLETVYYTGTAEEWNAISIIGGFNYNLTEADIVFNYVPQ